MTTETLERIVESFTGVKPVIDSSRITGGSSTYAFGRLSITLDGCQQEGILKHHYNCTVSYSRRLGAKEDTVQVNVNNGKLADIGLVHDDICKWAITQ